MSTSHVLREARREQGLSARAAADALGYGDGRAIRRLEAGERPISPRLALAIEALRLGLHDIPPAPPEDGARGKQTHVVVTRAIDGLVLVLADRGYTEAEIAEAVWAWNTSTR